jgi:hypothetical protein
MPTTPLAYFAIKNYERYQHYKDRNPPWIKLYRDFISDYELRQLSPEARLMYIGCLILASETLNRVPHDYDYLTQRLGFPITYDLITTLFTSGFLLALSDSTECPPRREEENREEKIYPPFSAADFELFWSQYPKHKDKKTAALRWKSLTTKHVLPAIDVLLAALTKAKLSDDWKKNGGTYIPHASTWLNGQRWEDEIPEKPKERLPV